MTWNNLTFMDNVTTATQVVEGVNNLSGGWFVGGLMIALFVIVLMVFYGRVGVGEIFLGGGFLYTILTLLFVKMALLPPFTIGIAISMMIFGILAIYMSD